MSDYFTALATRAVNADGGLMPRPRTPFEPVVGGPGDASVTAVAFEQVSGAEEASGEDVPARRTTAATRSGRHSAQVSSREADAAPGEAAVPRLDRQQESIDGPEAIGAQPHPTVRVVTSETDRVIERLREVAEPSLPMSRRAGANVTPPSPSRPVRSERSASPDRGVLPASDDGSEPTIRIHIGRVEVRAVAPASSTKASRALQDRRDGALMTLEDYARKRKEGRS